MRRRRIRLLRRAAHQISEAFKWWGKNRPAAPKAFTRDLRLALRAIAEQPLAGKLVDARRLPGVRRVYVSRIRYYLYFRIDPEDGAVQILALWHASRGSEPRL